MKAFYFSAYGGPEVMKFGELPDPVAGEGQLLIEVKAVSINPVDYKIRQGHLKVITGKNFPMIPCGDLAGIVQANGNNVIAFKPGDKVYGFVPTLFRKQGALAELVVVPVSQVSHITNDMTFETAATLPVAALTALNGLRKGGSLNGKSVLVNGATGGVGHFAIQLAKAKGAAVAAVCSHANTDLAKKFGADEVYDYASGDFAALSDQFDLIVDAYGKMKLRTACRLLRNKGVYATTLAKPTLFISSLFVQVFLGKKLTSANMRGNPEDFAEIESLFHQGRITPFIENTFDFDHSPDAFRLAEQGKVRGKVVIRIRE